MTLRLGDTAPDFTAETTRGRIEFHSWLGDSWALLFSHPRDFTPVCTTELGQVALLERHFQRRGVKLIALSIDTVVSHEQWLHDIRDAMGANVHFPIIADFDRSIATLYGMLHPNHDSNQTVRTVFVIDAAKKVRLTIAYPQSCGRNFEEAAADDRFPAADRCTRRRHAGALARRRRRHHPAGDFGRGSAGPVPEWLARGETLFAHHCGPARVSSQLEPMKILLVDQDAELCALLAFTLGQSGYECCTAADRDGALQLLELESPDLALLDHTPLLDGIELCGELRRRSQLPIMILNAHDREDTQLAAFDAGADDYLRKPFSPRVLIARVKGLLRRIGGTEPVKVITVGQVVLDVEEHALQIGPAGAVRLTPLEFTAIHLLLSTPGRTVTAARMLTQLWGPDSGGKQRMLKQLIYRLRRKIELDPAAPRLIVTTPHAGYRFETES